MIPQWGRVLSAFGLVPLTFDRRGPHCPLQERPGTTSEDDASQGAGPLAAQPPYQVGSYHADGTACPQCPYLFRASSATPAEAILKHLIDEGPWLGLAHGETFGDMIRTALRTRGVIYCPECGTAVSISKKIRSTNPRSRAKGP